MSATTYFANYTIGTDAYQAVPGVCKLYGSRALLVGGAKAMAAAAPALDQALAGSGICGIAVVSAIYGQPDIQQAARTLRTKTEEMISQ